MFSNTSAFIERIFKDLWALMEYFESKNYVGLLQTVRAIMVSLKNRADHKIYSKEEPKVTTSLQEFRNEIRTQLAEMHQIFLFLLGMRSYSRAFKATMMKFSIWTHYHMYKHKIEKYYADLRRELERGQPLIGRNEPVYEYNPDVEIISKVKNIMPKKRMYTPGQVRWFTLDYYPKGISDTVISYVSQDMIIGNGSNFPVNNYVNRERTLCRFIAETRQRLPLSLFTEPG